MIFIAHRGNTQGPNPTRENHPDYLKIAIKNGYNVEVDVWRLNNSLVLGHDNPQYQITDEFLNSLGEHNFLWTHTKNIEALQYMLDAKNLNFTKQWNFFWHQEDDYTVTSGGYIWAYPGKHLTQDSICVMPEILTDPYSVEQMSTCKGICSDYIERYK